MPFSTRVSNTFRKPGRTRTTHLGLPLFDRGVLQGVIVVQTVEPRKFSSDEMRMLLTAAGQLGPLVSTVRALEQHVAPAHDRLRMLAANLWWSWDAETVSIFRDLDPVRWRRHAAYR